MDRSIDTYVYVLFLNCTRELTLQSSSFYWLFIINKWNDLTEYIRVIFDQFFPLPPHSQSAKLPGNKVLSKYCQNLAPFNHPAVLTQVNVAIIPHLAN